jgi:polyisoprenoid-binding protein YceI
VPHARPTLALAALAVAAVCGAARAADTVWTTDLVHSRAEFRISHLIVSKVWGHIGIKSVTLVTTPAGMPSSIDAVLSAANLDTDNRERDADLRSAAYLDVERYPTMTFASRSVVATGKDGFRAAGDLTIRGITKPVVLVGRIEGKIPDPAGERVGYSAQTTIDRRDFGITDARLSPAGIPLVGNDVEIGLTLEATRPK